MNKTTHVKIYKPALALAIREAGFSYTKASKMLGQGDNYISNVLYTKTMEYGKLEQLCLILDKDPNSFIDHGEQKTEKSEDQKPDDKAWVKGLEDKISGLQNELHNINKLLAQMAESDKNFHVAMNQYMKDFKNHKKYGHF